MSCWTHHRATPSLILYSGDSQDTIAHGRLGPRQGWQCWAVLLSSPLLLTRFFRISSVLFYLADYLRLNVSRSFKLLYFLKERQVEMVSRVDKSLDFDLNIYLRRLVLSISPGCAKEDSSSIPLAARFSFKGRA